MVIRTNSLENFPFLISYQTQKCDQCLEPIFDIAELPENYQPIQCQIDACNRSFHKKCYKIHKQTHSTFLRTKDDFYHYKTQIGLSNAIKSFDSCLLCKRKLNNESQLCTRCQNMVNQ